MSKIGTRFLKITIEGVEYTAEVSKCVVGSGEAESDFVTFADAASGGGRDYKLQITAAQDAATGSLWDLIWTQAGTVVDFTVNPYGNTTPSASQPHFTGQATVKEPNGDFLGGEANASTSAKFTFDVEWPCEAKPTRVTA